MERFLLFLAGVVTGATATALVARVIRRRRTGRRAASLSHLAHELRTPLSSVTAYTEILRDEEAIEPAERSRFLGIIHEEAGKMEAMIEDRLGAGRSGEGRSQTAAATPSTQARTSAPGAALRTILVVDDDRFLVEATRTLLTREGFVALGAFGGAEALAQARLLQPDLILMDLGMPGMTGEETLRHLRDDAATREIPVLITTGDDTAPALKGAAAVLTKPVTRERLIAAIEAAARPAQPTHFLGGTHR